MSIINGINEPADLLLKLIREGNRINTERNPDDLIDHLFNFSVTAHALRDWVIKYLKVESQSEKEAMHIAWNNFPCLVAAKNIANSSKHFGLEANKVDKHQTTVLEDTRQVVELFGLIDSPDIMSGIVDGNGIDEPLTMTLPSFTITFSTFLDLDLWEYVTETITYWMAYFDKQGIPRDKRYGLNFLFWRRDFWPRLLADQH